MSTDPKYSACGRGDLAQACQFLRGAGDDAVHVREFKMQRAENRLAVEKARVEERVLLADPMR